MLAVEHRLVRASLTSTPCGPSDEDTPRSVVARLDVLKRRVPGTIRRVGSRRWNAIVNAPPCATHTRSRVANRAYHKLCEILLSCGVPLPRHSVHLCEAPGGFVRCVADLWQEERDRHLSSSSDPPPWTWRAVSLPCTQRGIPSMDSTLVPCDGSGDWHDADIFDDATMATLFPSEGDASFLPADLVTADGAREMDHDRLEEEHVGLLWAQTRTAFRCLKRPSVTPQRQGGTFVIKFFEGLRPATLAWIAFMTTHFDVVSVMKPTSSRATNSERYLVARGFSPDAEHAAPLHPSDARRPSGVWCDHANRVLERMAEDQIHALQQAFFRASD